MYVHEVPGIYKARWWIVPSKTMNNKTKQWQDENAFIRYASVDTKLVKIYREKLTDFTKISM